MLLVIGLAVISAGVELVPTPPDAATFAAAVSADGTTVVGQLAFDDGRVEAFRFRVGEDALEILGDLEGGLHFTTANAVSADGSVVAGVGYQADAEGSVDGDQVAWTYTTATGFRVLEDAEGGSVLAFASGISDDGRVVVGASYDEREDFVAVRWDDGVLSVIGALAATQPRSDARGVSGDGRVVVGGSSAGAGAFPRTASFRADERGLRDLGDLDGGANFCSAQAVSGDGRIIVGSASSGLSGENFLEAFRKDGDGPLEPLGDLEGGAFGSDALDVSAFGDVIVGRSVVNDNEDEAAFIWTPAGGMRTLADEAAAAGIDSNDGVTLSQATSVSANGEVVVGNALIDDGAGGERRVQAFILALPPNDNDNDNDDDDDAGSDLLNDVPRPCGCAGGGDVGVFAALLVLVRRRSALRCDSA